MYHGWLLGGGVLSAIAALLHAACIVGGPSWYRFFGAGERMARMAEQGAIAPTLITLCITAMLTVAALYAWSGAGVIGRLPLVRPALALITAIYLIRATALPAMLAHMPDRGTTFLVSSSVIVFVFGVVHAVGLTKAWTHLAR